ncbi:hypothetical protein AYM40_02200 [Paraburkholderia phytofirmans OLGA172]|jgi:hypothetical protein|uniref:Uncharacterized protein n=1 Tax=Paraburkholderia phytofirmans OLGA172 TaxID=1417228 RepID=A0A160FGU1_9BURK|nr:hypothetical protein [Paraburkholderia phytofirmans]ANB71310.1 hypothetical protein AYM40_02200 [Paraburkholderia phytofirmans OLGA172]
MNQIATVDNVFAELMKASSNPRQRESLERIKKACDYLEEQGLKISPPAIEGYCLDRDWGGPKGQSIRNSKVLSHYVEIRQSGQKVTINRNAVSAEPLIADETIRAYVRLLQEERDQAVAARNRIEAGLRTIPGIPVDDLIRVGFGGTPASTTAAHETAQLPTTVREALSLLFEPNHLANCGLQLHKDRLRQAVTGNVLLEKHHVVALRSLAADKSDSDATA